MAEKKVPYQLNGRAFEGMIVYDDAVKAKRLKDGPGALRAPGNGSHETDVPLLDNLDPVTIGAET